MADREAIKQEIKTSKESTGLYGYILSYLSSFRVRYVKIPLPIPNFQLSEISD